MNFLAFRGGQWVAHLCAKYCSSETNGGWWSFEVHGGRWGFVLTGWRSKRSDVKTWDFYISNQVNLLLEALHSNGVTGSALQGLLTFELSRSANLQSQFEAMNSAEQGPECLNAVMSGSVVEGERIWRELRKILEELTKACGGGEYNAIDQNLRIHVHQCRHMHSVIEKLFRNQRECRNPSAEEFLRITTRALKLVEQCSAENWLLKAVEIGDCPEHFVELYLDLHWSLSLAGGEIGCDEFLDNLRAHRENDKLSLISRANEVLASQASQVADLQLASILIMRDPNAGCCDPSTPSADLDKQGLTSETNELLEVINKDHGYCQVEKKLASVRRDRKGRFLPYSTPPDLEKHVRKWSFNISVKYGFFKLAQGGFSFVVKYPWVYKTEFVLKLALKPCEEADMIKKEADIMEKCRHPYIVGMVGFWKIGSKSLMMMESMNCTVTELMEARKRKPTLRVSRGFSASEAIGLLLPVAKAIRNLHGKEMPIAHRDIKPDNIMCTGKSEFTTKLIDFGESVEFDPDDVFTSRDGVAFTTRRYGVTGTPGYIAPEVRDCNKSGYYDPLKTNVFPFRDLLKADVFSFGMVFGELLTVEKSEEALRAQTKEILSPSEVKHLLEAGWRPRLPDDLPIYVAFIVESCWRKSSSSRPGFGDICLMLQNAQLLLNLKLKVANTEEALSIVSYTDSDGSEWPISGKFTSVREMLALENEPDSDSILRDFLEVRAGSVGSSSKGQKVH